MALDDVHRYTFSREFNGVRVAAMPGEQACCELIEAELIHAGFASLVAFAVTDQQPPARGVDVVSVSFGGLRPYADR